MATNAERDLIRFLKKHSKEQIDFEDMETGETTGMSRVEVLSLIVWKLAHGHAVYQDVKDKETGVPVRKLVNYYPPDKSAITLLFDHLVGKPKAPPAKSKNDRTPRGVPVGKRLSGALAKFQAASGGDSGEGDTKRPTEAGAESAVSRRFRELGLSGNRNKRAKRSTEERGVEGGSTPQS